MSQDIGVPPPGDASREGEAPAASALAADGAATGGSAARVEPEDSVAPPTEPRKPTLPPAPATVPRPTSSRSQRPEVSGSQPAPVAALAGAGAEVPAAPRAPHIDPYDNEVTTEYDPFGDDAPTVDYDPRARGIYVSPVGSAPPPAAGRPATPAPQARERPAAESSPPGPPPVPSLGSDRPMARPNAPPRPGGGDAPSSSQRRRSSRRTVRIPNDETDRLSFRSTPPPGPAPIEAEPPTIPEFDETTIIKPMRIVSIGSEPPPVRHPTPAHAAPAARTGPSAHEDLEHGWTPTPAAVALAQPEPIDTQATVQLLPAVTDSMLAEAGLGPEAPPVSDSPVTARSGAELAAIESLDEGPSSEEAPELELIEAELTARPAPPPPPPKPARAPQNTPVAAPAPPPAPPPPLADEGGPKKPKPWWEDLFGDDYIRTLDRLGPTHIRREANFIEESLGLERGAVILDLACGEGQHSVELAERGYSVVGFDLSLPMLSRAADEAQDRGQKINFLHGDMREMAFDEMFDGIFCWSTSFGYFDDERNYAVLQRIHRALRQGGNFLLDVINRDYVAPRAPSLVWFEGDGCTCMDDMYVDFFTSRLRVKRTAMFDDGHSRELDYSIRLYTLHELGKMLHEVGFKVVEVTGHTAHPGVFFGAESPRMIILAERA